MNKLPAVFMRGGTSKALMFHLRDLPADRAGWDALFLTALGSPDPHGRQLNGMGGGVSSLSKVCVLGPPTRPDADLDYTFAQILVTESRVDYSGNCGNMSSAVGPFAIEEGLVAPREGEMCVRIHNTNTSKIINATFRVKDGRAVVAGDLEIPGVAGTGSPVRLDFLEPGGAVTGKLLPTGKPRDVLDIPGLGLLEASMVDAANPCVFLDAKALGLTGTEMPDVLERDRDLLARIATIRCHASVAMGIARTLGEAATKSMPQIGFVSAPQDAATLSGEMLTADAADLTVRIISNGQPHRALPLTGSLCTAVAAGIEGTIPHQYARPATTGTLRLAMPSGVLTVGGEVVREGGQWRAVRGSFFRTTRRLFEGYVYT
ncbi:MAG: PrpF domain-containing protein [Betaproteobacteria bacterium]